MGHRGDYTFGLFGMAGTGVVLGEFRIKCKTSRYILAQMDNV